MADAMRILFISGEVSPFSDTSEAAGLVRSLPEALHESGRFETRIMMPRYGTVSERKNRLHEVIRLSGSEITLGDRTEMLRVKVASIPGIRLQVYFMDNDYYFKRKGIFADRQGVMFEDNLQRSAFYARSVIRTIRNLGWKPDLVHSFGWLSGLVPYVLRTEFNEDELFKEDKIVYTPEKVDFDTRFEQASFDHLTMAPHDDLIGGSPVEAGIRFADATILPPSMASSSQASFSGVAETEMDEAVAVYEKVLAGIPA
ncbi:MAG: glycogen synthase [Bacteroidetes Order II. Incertae sedis bacterium]|nr:glycogen synthase [Bacteroidetes Order II. bacterium]